MPLVAALLVGAGIERNLHITVCLIELGRIDLGARPALGVLVVLTLLTLALPRLRTAPAANEARV